MANAERKVRRTLHFRFTMPSADPSQILSFVNASKPFYECSAAPRCGCCRTSTTREIHPGHRIRDPNVEMNRQRIAGDMRLQTYLQAWRAMLPGGVEIDVFKDVEP